MVVRRSEVHANQFSIQSWRTHFSKTTSKFHVLCCCLIDSWYDIFTWQLQYVWGWNSNYVCLQVVLECFVKDVIAQRHSLPAMPTVALPNRAVGGKSRAIRLQAKSCLAWARARARAGVVQQHAQRNNICQPRKERMSWLNCFAKEWALC